MSVSETQLGSELVAEWEHINTCQVPWIIKLAEFDRDALYAVDGFSTCTSWLEVKCAMARSTAFERTRIARELLARPVVRAAFEGGDLKFSHVRILTRLEGLNDERDRAFVADAPNMTMRALERRVQDWNYIHGPDDKPGFDAFGLTYSKGFMDGFGQVVLEGPNDFLERALSIIDAYGDHVFNSKSYPQGEGESPMETRSFRARRADQLLDLLEMVAYQRRDIIDPDKAALGVTVAYEQLLAAKGIGTTQYGTPLSGEAVRRLACDAGVHRIVVAGASEILDVGRKTRVWTTAMRRAIHARHNHQCAVGGCGRRILEIHHMDWWELGGITSILNGIPLCSFHHHLVHEGGWYITWSPITNITRLVGPQGQIIETTTRIDAAA